MENYIKDYFVIKDENAFFTFDLNKKNTLSYKMHDNEFNILDKNILREKDVLKYSITIDDKNNMHILYLLKSGSLHLQTYNNKTWKDFVIGELDLESNKYHQLELFFIKGKFHILYGYSNLINSNICMIQHMVYKKNIEQKYNVIRYVSKNNSPYFSVDYDSSGTIHILYNTITNTQSYIYHCFYSPYRKVWSNNPKSLWKGENNGFSYIFIDKMDSIHGLWLKKANNKYTLSYKKMNTKGKDQYIWKEISLDISLSNNAPFILYEKDKKLYLCFVKEKDISIFKSQDYGESWIKDDKFIISEISRMKIIVNQSLDLSLKINHLLNDHKNIINSKFIKKVFPNIISDCKESELLYIKDNKKCNSEKNEISQVDKEKLEEIIKDIFINKKSIKDKYEEEIIKDIFIDNISDFETPDFSHIKDDINKDLEKNVESGERKEEDKSREYIEELKLQISNLKFKIDEILNSQSKLEERVDKLLDKENYCEREILKIKEEIKELQIPIIKKIFS